MPIETSGDWAQFGIAGLVIFALFASLWKMLGEHRAERNEWRQSAEKREEKTERALTELTRVIRDRNR